MQVDELSGGPTHGFAAEFAEPTGSSSKLSEKRTVPLDCKGDGKLDCNLAERKNARLGRVN